MRDVKLGRRESEGLAVGFSVPLLSVWMLDIVEEDGSEDGVS